MADAAAQANFDSTTVRLRALLADARHARPGTNRTNLLRTLGEVRTVAYNLRGGGRPAPGRVTSYIEWAILAVRQLTGQKSGNNLTASFGSGTAAADRGSDLRHPVAAYGRD